MIGMCRKTSHSCHKHEGSLVLPSKGVVNRGARGAKAPPVIQVLVLIFEKNFGDLARVPY